MKLWWFKLRWLCAAVLLASLGCRSTQPSLKPPTKPEEFNVPPEAEARFTKPVTYPEDSSFAASKRKTPGGASPLSDPSRFAGAGSGRGAGAGMMNAAAGT